MAACPSIALHKERDGEHFSLLLCMAISDKKTERASSLQMCRDNEEMESSCCRQCRYVSFVSFFANAKIKTPGKPCLAKNDAGLKPANKMQLVIGQLSGKCEVLTGINFV